MTDPIFSERASPFSFIGPKRIVPPAMQQDDLPPIQATIISHNHYDHLDAATIAKLGNTVNFFVPLGMANWFRDLGVDNSDGAGLVAVSRAGTDPISLRAGAAFFHAHAI